MLQPDHGIFIYPWYDDPHDNALFALTPLLEEIVNTQANVPAMLSKYADQIPKWAGFTEGRQFTSVWQQPYEEYDYDGRDYDVEEPDSPVGGGSLTGPYQAQPPYVAKPSSPFGPYQAPRPSGQRPRSR